MNHETEHYINTLDNSPNRARIDFTNCRDGWAATFVVVVVVAGLNGAFWGFSALLCYTIIFLSQNHSIPMQQQQCLDYITRSVFASLLLCRYYYVVPCTI